MTSPYNSGEKLDEMFEASKDDRNSLVGSEVRSLISDVREARARSEQSQPVGYLAPLLTREEWVIVLPMIQHSLDDAIGMLQMAMENEPWNPDNKSLHQMLVDNRSRRVDAIRAIYDKIYKSVYSP